MSLEGKRRWIDIAYDIIDHIIKNGFDKLDATEQYMIERVTKNTFYPIKLFVNFALYQAGATCGSPNDCVIWNGPRSTNDDSKVKSINGSKGLPVCKGTINSSTSGVHPAVIAKLLLDGKPPTGSTFEVSSLELSHCCDKGPVCSSGNHGNFESRSENKLRTSQCHHVDSCIEHCTHTPKCIPIQKNVYVCCYRHKDLLECDGS